METETETEASGRPVAVPMYALALLLSLILFATGIYVGNWLDRSSTESISQEVYRISDRMGSVQLLLLMESNASAFCPVYLSELGSIDEEVEKVGYKLSYLEDQKNVRDDDLKKRYFVLEAQSYLLSQKMKELCQDPSVLLINFYSNRACTDCHEQGIRILQTRDEFAGQGVRLKLFSFDGELGSPVADAFRNRYNVSVYPTVVVDGMAYPGLQSRESLRKAVGGG